MNMDRNTVIGFVLLAVLLFVYLFTATRNSNELQAQQKKIQDSIANVKRIKDSFDFANRKIDTTTKRINLDSTGFSREGVESIVVVENELVKISFTNKGGQPKFVELKNYRTTDGQNKPVVLNASGTDRISYSINSNNQSTQIGDIYFKAGEISKNADQSQTIRFVASGKNGETVNHTFTLKPWVPTW